MGAFGISSSSFDDENGDNIKIDINPNPSNYEVLDGVEIGDYIILKINYPNCTNYEGNKILLFKCRLKELQEQELIDPHFSNNPNYISPIARFEPTEDGWDNAVLLASSLDLETHTSKRRWDRVDYFKNLKNGK